MNRGSRGRLFAASAIAAGLCVSLPGANDFSGPDYVHAALDAAGAAIWLQAAILFPFGILDSYGDESDGHFARTVAHLAYQPIRFGTESILELSAHRHYRGLRRVRAVAAFYPQLTGFDAESFPRPVPKRARDWVEGAAAPLVGFETAAPIGPWLTTQSRFLYSSRSGAFRDDVAFYMGQGFSHAIEVLPGLRAVPGISLGALYSDAWSGSGEDDFDHVNSVSFLAGPGLALEAVFGGIWTARLEAAVEGGPVLHSLKYNHFATGGPGNANGLGFQRALAVRARAQAGAGLAF